MFVLLHHEQQGLTLADVRKRKFIVRGVCVCVCVCVSSNCGGIGMEDL